MSLVTERVTDRPPTTPGRGESFVRVVVTYVVALAVGAAWLLAGPDSGQLWLDALVADLLATLVVFASSRLHHNSSLYDAYWSVAPPLLVVWWWTEREPGTDAARFALLAVVMVVWSVRLTANWASSWPGLEHEDWRYTMLRERAGRFELLVDLFAIRLSPGQTVSRHVGSSKIDSASAIVPLFPGARLEPGEHVTAQQRLGTDFGSAVRQFVIMAVVNSAIVWTVNQVALGGRDLSLGNTLFFVLLISLLMTFYDRYRPLYKDRVAQLDRQFLDEAGTLIGAR